MIHQKIAGFVTCLMDLRIIVAEAENERVMKFHLLLLNTDFYVNDTSIIIYQRWCSWGPSEGILS